MSTSDELPDIPMGSGDEPESGNTVGTGNISGIPGQPVQQASQAGEQPSTRTRSPKQESGRRTPAHASRLPQQPVQGQGQQTNAPQQPVQQPQARQQDNPEAQEQAPVKPKHQPGVVPNRPGRIRREAGDTSQHVKGIQGIGYRGDFGSSVSAQAAQQAATQQHAAQLVQEKHDAPAQSHDDLPDIGISSNGVHDSGIQDDDQYNFDENHDDENEAPKKKGFFKFKKSSDATDNLSVDDDAHEKKPKGKLGIMILAVIVLVVGILGYFMISGWDTIVGQSSIEDALVEVAPEVEHGAEKIHSL